MSTPANALVLRSEEGGSIILVPTANGRMDLDVVTPGAPVIHNSFDQEVTRLIRDYLSAWLRD